MLVHRRVTPSIYVADTRLYTWVGRGTGESSVLPNLTQHKVSGQGSNQDRSIQSRAY